MTITKANILRMIALLTVSSAMLPGQNLAPPTLAGTWNGTLGTGSVQLHVALSISSENGKDYKGQLNSKDQHALLAMEIISLDGDTVRFEVRQVGGLYVGTINKERNEINGTWTQTGVAAQPLSFKRETQQTPTAELVKRSKIAADSSTVVPIDVSIPFPPHAFKADGRWDLAYELRITSFADTGDVTITRVDVLNSNLKAMVSLSGDELKASLDPGAAVGLTLHPRTFTTLYMWISASSLDEIPTVLRHRVTIKPSYERGEPSTVTPAVPVDRKPVLVIGPPLRGENWMASNGPANSSVHRRAILPVAGRAAIGQRFAIDWAQVYSDGLVYRGDQFDNKNYRCYGQPVYAVADGVITEATDGIPENVPGRESRAVEITFDNVAGNHVIEQIADGVYAVFAHLQPKSLTVKLGDRVHQGQVLGLLGNSGNSTAPHLHFQICDGNSVLGCEGLPYAFVSFEVQGLWKAEGSSSHREMEIPTGGEVIKFTAVQ
jgi:hypothetical protein